jgi:adenosylmethionine-8-amino-7-oxononanoate aminotransferase
MAITTLPTKYLMLYDEDINKALFHGHTFTANPTGCAAALASLELLNTEKANLVQVNKNHLAFQSKIKHPKVDTTRV